MVRKTKKQKHRKTRCSAGKPLFIFYCPEKNLSATQKIRTLYYGLHYQVFTYVTTDSLKRNWTRRERFLERRGGNVHTIGGDLTPLLWANRQLLWSFGPRLKHDQPEAWSTPHCLPVSLKIFSSGGTTEQRLLRTRVPNFRAFFSELL